MAAFFDFKSNGCPFIHFLFADLWSNSNCPVLRSLKSQEESHFLTLTISLPMSQISDTAPKSHFCDLTRKTEVTGLSDLMTLFIDLGCLYCKQTQRACFQKHTKLIENQFSRSKVIQNSID
jgi:hypothetical protein